MGLLDFWRGPARAEDRSPFDDRFFPAVTRVGISEIAIPVTVERARQVPVVRDCLATLANGVSGLEHIVYRRTGETRARLTDHPILALLAAPNRRDTSVSFLRQLTDDLAAYGETFHRIVLDGSGSNIEALVRLPPPAVTVEELIDVSTGLPAKRFKYRDAAGQEQVLLEREVWHIALPPMQKALRGTSPILHDGVEAVAVAIALQRYSNSLFTNDATPPYVLKMPVGQKFDNEDSKANFLRAVTKWARGRFKHTPMTLEHGIEVERLGLTAEEAQFLETRKELWLDLARLWGVPPHKVGLLDKATFSNIEHQALEFVTDTLRPYLELIEQSISRFLIPEQDVHFAFDVATLLRGDIKARYEAYAIGRQWGWLSVNDILKLENRNGIGAAGDRYIEPLNMVPVGTTPRDRGTQQGVESSIAFLRDSVAKNGGRPKLEIVADAA